MHSLHNAADGASLLASVDGRIVANHEPDWIESQQCFGVNVMLLQPLPLPSMMLLLLWMPLLLLSVPLLTD